jgi:1-acyl-sn-glycerol-3-phosphate acyltransferase
MAWRPRPSDRFYRAIVRTGLALRRLFRIRVIVTGQEHLPASAPQEATSGGPSRPVLPAVSAAGHVVVGYETGAHAYDAAVRKLRDNPPPVDPP